MSMPKGWEEVRLGDICSDVIGGGTPSTKNSKFWQGDIPWISSSDLIDESIYHIDTTRFITQEAIDKSATKLIPKNSVIVVTRVGLGKLAINDKELCTSQDFQSLIFKNQNYLFMAYAIKHNIYDTIKIMQGTSIKGITKEQLKSMKIKLPPLKEQEKIAEILSSCDEHIKNLKNLKSELEKEKLHLMNELLSGKTRFSSFTTPWQEVRLEDLALKMQSGGTPRATNKAYYGGNIPFVKISDITNSFKYLNDTEVKITELGLNNSSAWIVPKNSIIYSMYASVGFLAINTIEVATSQAMINIIPNLEKVDLNYLYYYLDDYKKYISKFIETGTQGNLNAQSVKSFTIKLPSLEEQKKIGEVLSACDERLECLNELITAETTLKSHLLTELLSGNIRVNA